MKMIAVGDLFLRMPIAYDDVVWEPPKAICCLHNFLIQTDSDVYIPPNTHNYDDWKGLHKTDWRFSAPAAAAGPATEIPPLPDSLFDLRNSLCDFLVNGPGKLDWQEEAIRYTMTDWMSPWPVNMIRETF